MSTITERIEALHREFAKPGTAMGVEHFNRLMGELLDEERGETLVIKSGQGVASSNAPVTLKVMKTIVERMAQTTREHVEKALQSRDAKIAELERRLAELVDVQKGNCATMNSLERRASRHADHLARLETRTRSMERGGGA